LLGADDFPPNNWRNVISLLNIPWLSATAIMDTTKATTLNLHIIVWHPKRCLKLFKLSRPKGVLRSRKSQESGTLFQRLSTVWFFNARGDTARAPRPGLEPTPTVPEFLFFMHKSIYQLNYCLFRNGSPLAAWRSYPTARAGWLHFQHIGRIYSLGQKCSTWTCVYGAQKVQSPVGLEPQALPFQFVRLHQSTDFLHNRMTPIITYGFQGPKVPSTGPIAYGVQHKITKFPSLFHEYELRVNWSFTSSSLLVSEFINALQSALDLSTQLRHCPFFTTIYGVHVSKIQFDEYTHYKSTQTGQTGHSFPLFCPGLGLDDPTPPSGILDACIVTVNTEPILYLPNPKVRVLSSRCSQRIIPTLPNSSFLGALIIHSANHEQENSFSCWPLDCNTCITVVNTLVCLARQTLRSGWTVERCSLSLASRYGESTLITTSKIFDFTLRQVRLWFV